MRKAARAACVLAAGVGLLASDCGGKQPAVPISGGYAQPSSAAPESSSPSTEAPASTGAPEPSPPSTEGPKSSPPAQGAGPLEIRTRETRFGRILVDGRGMTIYVSAKDNADFESTCAGPCTKEWPPLYTNGQVNAGPGVNSAWLGTIGRSDGPTQVEYNGWPLYYSARDGGPGDMKGQGVVSNGTTWYVIDADKGQEVK
jgi:predicted lipoprotein with Yx(FWY)xxD motif